MNSQIRLFALALSLGAVFAVAFPLTAKATAIRVNGVLVKTGPPVSSSVVGSFTINGTNDASPGLVSGGGTNAGFDSNSISWDLSGLPGLIIISVKVTGTFKGTNLAGNSGSFGYTWGGPPPFLGGTPRTIDMGFLCVSACTQTMTLPDSPPSLTQTPTGTFVYSVGFPTTVTANIRSGFAIDDTDSIDPTLTVKYSYLTPEPPVVTLTLLGLAFGGIGVAFRRKRSGRETTAFC